MGPNSRASLGVVVPTVDEQAVLARLLARLAPAGAGPDHPDELVVSDGGSSDRTRELAAAAGARVVLGPRGRGAQLAAGARACSCDLLLFLHADCLPQPGALASLRAAFEAPGVLWGAMRQRVEAAGAFYRLVERCADLRVRWPGLVFGDSGLAVRRAAYRSVGGFRCLPIFEDVDLSRRLRRLGPPRLVGAAQLLVSPRRWQREGALRATLRNWIMQAAYVGGVDPRRLARHYRPHTQGRSSP